MNLQAALEQRSKVEEFQRKHRIGLLTLLFTDLVGSTQLKQELGDHEAVALIQRHRAIVREILRGFSEGEEIETAGDSFFLVFAKPSDAVQFSLMVQGRLRGLRREIPRPLLIRIGLHIGEVVIEERPDSPKPKDLYGLQIDICARVMSLAQGDQILMTRSAFDNARQVLKGQEIEGVGSLSWLNHGPYVMKGVEEPIEICEVGELGEAILKPPADSEKVHRYVSPDAEPVLGWRPALEQKVPGTQWVLEEKLGEGGFGEVWLGQHATTKEQRVFKFCFRADRVRSLKREVTLFRLLKERVGEHPNVVRLLDVYFEEPPYYLEMEYVGGRDLKSWCEAQGGIEVIPLETRLEIVAQVADALQAAHEAGVIHRDVKPSNILISRSSRGHEALTPNQKSEIRDQKSGEPPDVGCSGVEVKLTDFGIGQVVSQEALAGMTRLGFTQTMMSPGSTVQSGTQLYMAPELIAGKPASTRSDIYSLGVVLYQLLVSDLACPLTTDWQAQIEDPLLCEDLERCFAGSPAQRFASAGELALSLRSLRERRAAAAKKQADLAALERAAYRRGIMRTATVAAAAVAVFAILAFYAMRQRDRAEANLSPVHVQTAEKYLGADDTPAALAHLARALRLDPNNRVAAERLISALSQRNLPLPTIQPLKHYSDVVYSEFSPDGKQIVTASRDNTVRVWDSETGAPITPRLRHDEAVVCAQFSYNGRTVVTSTESGRFRLWDSHSGRALTEPIQHFPAGHVYQEGALLSPNRKWILGDFGAGQDRLRGWDINSGHPLTPLINQLQPEGSKDRQNGRGSFLYHDDTCVEVWDLNSLQLVAVLPHSEKVWDAKLNSTGDLVVSVSGKHVDPRANVWDARNGRRISQTGILSRTESLGVFAWFNTDGNTIVTGYRDGLPFRLWNIWTGQEVEHSVTPIAIPDAWDSWVDDRRAQYSRGCSLLTSYAGDLYAGPLYVKIVDLWSGRGSTERILVDHNLGMGDAVIGLAGARFRYDRLRVVTGGTDRLTKVWDIRNGKALPLVLKHAATVLATQFSPDGIRVATASVDKTARVWNARTGVGVIPPLVHLAQVNSVQFSGDGKRIVTASDDGTARVWDAMTGEPISPPLRHNGKVNYAEFSPDNESIVSASADKTVRIWESRTGNMIGKPLLHDGEVGVARFRSPTEIITGSKDGIGRIWDLRTGLPEFLKHTAPVVDVNWSRKPVEFRETPRRGRGWAYDAEGFLTRLGFVRSISVFHPGVVTASADNSAHVWGVRGDALKHQGRVNSAQFSPDGQQIVTASADKTAQIWQASTSQALTEPLSHDAEIHYAEFSPDGLRVVTASADKTARVWGAQTGQALSEPLRHEGPVLSAKFSPDGRWVVTISADHTAKLWEVPSLSGPAPGWLADLAEAIANQRLNRDQVMVSLENTKFFSIKRRIAHSRRSDACTLWAKWFFADRASRPISVSSRVNVLDYVQRLIQENTVASLQDALRLSPTNQVALAALDRVGAAHVTNLTVAGKAGSLRVPSGDSTDQLETLWGRTELLRRTGKPVEALAVLDQSLTRYAHHAELWQTKARILEQQGNLEEARQAYGHAIDAAAAAGTNKQELLSRVLSSRSDILNKLSRPKEARADYLRAKGIPERDPKTPASCIDLSACYNAGLDGDLGSYDYDSDRGTFASLPRGLVSLDGITFDIRGRVYVAASSRASFAPAVTTIPVSQTVRRVHFLHAAEYVAENQFDSSIGTYVIHYTDGGSRELPIIHGVDIGAIELRNTRPMPKKAALVWTGSKDEYGRLVGLFRSTWDNPTPGTEISSIDFVSKQGDAAPFLIAITVEP